MPPNATPIVECTGVLNECDAETVDGGLDKNVVELKHANKRTLKLVWRNIIIFGYVHLAALYGAYLMVTSAKIYTALFGMHNYYMKTKRKKKGKRDICLHIKYLNRFFFSSFL